MTDIKPTLWDRIRTVLYTRLSFVIIALAVICVVVAVGASAFGAPPKVTHPHIQKDQPTAYWMRTPCEYEDSVNCYWDAGSQGNKKGHSFYVRYFPGSAHMVCVTYAQRWFAKKNDYCTGDDTGAKIVAHPDFDRDGFRDTAS